MSSGSGGDQSDIAHALMRAVLTGDQSDHAEQHSAVSGSVGVVKPETGA